MDSALSFDTSGPDIGGNTPYPSVYPLELVLPRQASTSPASGTRGVGLSPGSPYPAIPATHRIFKAYPGLVYNIRAAVIGGSYPYSFVLQGAPGTMSINAATGEITWTDPQADATPTIVVTDSEGTQVSSPWTITVTTAGFFFVDAVSGSPYPTGDGSPTNPYQDFADLHDKAEVNYGDIVYFRSGTYTVDDMPRGGVGGAWERVEWNADDPQTFLAYPGETPLLDFGFVQGVSRGALFRFSGCYIDGFETRNDRNIGFQLTGQNYNVFRRLDMHDHNPASEDLDGQNPAHIMTTDGENWYTVIQDCEFRDSTTAGGLKLYNEGKMLIEDNLFHDMGAGCDWKVGIERGTFRGNRLWNLTQNGLYGNMNSRYDMNVRDCEVSYNLFNLPAIIDDGWDDGSVGLNWDGFAGRMDVYRNTILGRCYVAAVDSADGPFYWSKNVIVNESPGTPQGSHIEHFNVSDPTRITLDDNLTGNATDGVVDSAGNLTSSYAQFVGTHGFQR